MLLIAALLCTAGIVEGWLYRAPAVVASSVLIALVCLPLWALTSTIDAVKVLVLLAYLAAHQSGYLIGAFIGARGHDDR
ncbi:hypothetical protein JHFBIEKO_2336 [Methylobacterium mesophilicum]|nr:hypothetical protein FV233_06815 [Methylobacterium sp. WL7]TXN71371.1 hypothetical protein FV228_11275 [Methylobacterium sp. WL18]GJE21887.1 hypothetical protein JHFBIEKO_2336 [Methylobacterium mesophilicum]